MLYKTSERQRTQIITQFSIRRSSVSAAWHVSHMTCNWSPSVIRIIISSSSSSSSGTCRH